MLGKRQVSYIPKFYQGSVGMGCWGPCCLLGTSRLSLLPAQSPFLYRGIAATHIYVMCVLLLP